MRWMFFLALAGCTTGSGVLSERGRDLPAQAHQTRTLALELTSKDRLFLAVPFGDVTVRASAKESPSVVFEATAYAQTPEEGRALLQGVDADLKRTDAGVEIRAKVPLEDPSRRALVRTRIQAVVPPGTPLTVRVRSGDVAVSGPLGSCDVESALGDVTVRGATGDLVRAAARSGRVLLAGIKADHIEASTSLGALDLRDLAGALDAETSSGDIQLRGYSGTACKLVTSLGNLDAEGTFAQLTARTNSGTLRVLARPGSTVAASWNLATDLGDLALTLPPGLSFNLDASTDAGSIRTGFPVRAQRTAGGFGAAATGPVGRGGPSLVLRSSSGDIVLRRQG